MAGPALPSGLSPDTACPPWAAQYQLPSSHGLAASLKSPTLGRHFPHPGSFSLGAHAFAVLCQVHGQAPSLLAFLRAERTPPVTRGDAQ